MSDLPALFLAVANGTYHTHTALPKAVQDARALATVLEQRHGFRVKVLADLDRESLQESIEAELAPGIATGGRLILAWTGHAEIGPDKTLRMLGRSKTRDVEVANAAKLGEWAAQTGARQMLLLLDTCFSGGGTLDAIRLATAVNSGRASPEKTWFGVLAASQGDEPALSGALAREFERLLREGPRHLAMRWERDRTFIRGDDLMQTLVKEWAEPRQSPHPMSSGPVGDLVTNPLHKAGAPVVVVEELLQAARGGPGEVNFFVGRHAVLSAIVTWLRAGQPGLYIVTGPPGCGKSAVIGRIASLSSASERERILANGPLPDETDPGAGSVDAQLHARGLTLDTAVENLLKQLSAPAGEGLYGLLSMAEQRHHNGDPLTVAVDGLDEAQAFSGDLASQLIAPLARHALVLLGTVDGQTPNGEPLLKLVGPAAVVTDLGADGSSTRSDIRTYVIRRLEGAHRDMDPRAVADYVAPERGEQKMSFLLARLVISQLRETPVNTSLLDWRETIADSVETALERDMESVLLTIDGREHPTAARELLQALALSYGGGFPPDDVWPTVATAISTSGTHYTRDDVYRAIEPLARYLITGAEGDKPVYRIAHQRLTDYLKPEGGDPVAAAQLHRQVGDAIYRLYVGLLDSGAPPRAHQYLWRYAWRHLAAAETYGLGLVRQLVERDRESFLPDLADGLDYVSTNSFMAGNPDVAEQCSSEAVELRREIGKSERLILSMYQLAMAKLVKGDSEGADTVMSDASAAARDLSEGGERRTILGLVLGGAAMAQLPRGNIRSAQRMADEALALIQAPQGSIAANLHAYGLALNVKARCALMSGDLDQAASHAEQLIRLAQDARDNDLVMLVDAVGTLAWVQLAAGQTAQPDAKGKPPSAVGSAATLLENLRQLPRKPPAVASLGLARARLAVVQAEILDAAHGLRTVDLANLLRQIDETIETLRRYAQLADAAVLLAVALRLRWILTFETDPAAATRARDEAVAILRSQASSGPLAQGELGQLLDLMTQFELGAGVPEQPALKALLDRQQEAVGLLRKHAAYAQKVPDAILKLVLLCHTMGNTSAARFYRGEAIDATRELTPRFPSKVPVLAALLVDQAEELLFENPHEASALAKEALDIARSLEADHWTDFLAGAAAQLLAASRMVLGAPEEPEAHGKKSLQGTNPEGISELLEEARKRAEALPPGPLPDGLRAGIQLNLAVRALRERRFTDAVASAQHSLEYCSAVPENAKREELMHLIRLVLGLAQGGAGNTETGDPLIRSVLDPVVEAVIAGTTSREALTRLLNTAGDTEWERAISRLADRSDLRLAILLYRQRPKDEVHLTVQAVKAALDSAPPEQLVEIHTVARYQRALAPKEFDVAWLAAGGASPPWLMLTPAHMALTLSWLERPTWLRSKEFLAAHPDLLHPETDIALEELESAGVQPERVAAHRDILAIARREGVKGSRQDWCDAAYATVLAREALREWLHSGDTKGYLAEHPEFMANPEVIRVLQESAHENPVFRGLAALIQLAQRGEMAIAFKIAETEKATFALETLQKAWRALDTDRLASLATVVKTFNEDPKAVRTAAIALAIAHALSGRSDEAEPLAHEASSGAPPEALAELNAMLGDAITHHPNAAAALALCIAAMTAVGTHATATPT